MTALVLRLAGPLQSWGSRSRFVRRDTERAPTKSGVIGLLAAARGVRRTEELTEFFGLRFGVRIDQPGRLVRDFQTARSLDGTKSMPLSYRYYLADAVFVAAIEGDPALLQGFSEALRRPVFAPYLGRRSCPAAGPIGLGVRDGGIQQVLENEPWQAAKWHQRRSIAPAVWVETIQDTDPGDERAEVVRDEPLSFDPRRREYGWRPVLRGHVEIPNPQAPGSGGLRHDPMAVVGG